MRCDLYLVVRATKHVLTVTVVEQGEEEDVVICIVILIRFVLWVRFGILVGLLDSPGDYTVAGYVGVLACAQVHVHAAARFVLVAPPAAVTLEAVREGCDPSVAARTFSHAGCASQQGRMRGFSKEGFTSDPRRYDRAPIVRCALAIAMAAGYARAELLQRSPRSVTDPTFGATLYGLYG